jgi:hypothetical protein
MEEAIVKGLSPGEAGKGHFVFRATSENLGYRDHLGGRLAASADSFHGLHLEIEEYPCWDLLRPSNQAEQDHFAWSRRIIYPGLDMLVDRGHVPDDSRRLSEA